MEIMEVIPMKLNAKIYRQLTNEPFLTQDVDGRIVEFHYMNDTPYLIQYAGRGRFAIWTSDGQNYKVLIEKTYYEALEPFYQLGVNQIWLNFLEGVSKQNKKINAMFIYPTLILYVIIAVLATFLFKDYTMQILLGMLILVVVSNMVQGRIVSKRVQSENLRTQGLIRDFLGHEVFDGLVKAQELHYQAYFKFDEEPIQEEQAEESNIEKSEQSEEEK